MKIYILIVIFQIINKVVKSEVDEKCVIGNYCGSIPCSTNGFCNFGMVDFLNNSFFYGKQPELSCYCNIGYSSYDIEVLHLKESHIYCCYKQRSHLTAFYLELFLGFGFGYFYIGNTRFGLIKFFSQLFFCFTCWCTMYLACRKEHTIIINSNEINKKGNMEDNKKKNEIKAIKEINEDDENLFDEDENENKDDKNSDNNEGQVQDIDEQDNKILLSENLIKCPCSKFIIYSSAILFIGFYLIDLFIMGFGLHKDKNGESLNLWN